MGYGSRLPNANEASASPKTSGNPYGVSDETFSLLNMSAVRCCTCHRVIAAKHVTVQKGQDCEHAFCPDHVEEKKCCTPSSSRHFNVQSFREKQERYS